MSKNRPSPPQSKQDHADDEPASAPNTAMGNESIVGGVQNTVDGMDTVVGAVDSINVSDYMQPASMPATDKVSDMQSMSLVHVPKTFRMTLDNGNVILIPGGTGHIPTAYLDHWWVKNNGVKLINLDTKAVPQ